MNTSEYVESFLKTLPTKQNNLEGFFVVGLVGLPGSGKSTLSRALSAEIGLYVASNDKIRRWLDEYNVKDLDTHQGLVEKIAEARTQFLLKHGISHIIDADIIKYQDLVRQNAEAYGARLFIFYLAASEDVILKRLKQRKLHENSEQEDQLSRAGIEDYEARKMIHAGIGQLKEIDLVIDTTKGIDDEVSRVNDFLTRRLNVAP